MRRGEFMMPTRGQLCTPVDRVVGVFPSVASYLRLTICYLIEHSEDWENERSYIREDKVLGSLDRLHDLIAQAAN